MTVEDLSDLSQTVMQSVGPTAYCPECGRQVVVERPQLGQLLTCSRCRSDLEVINLEPLQLDWTMDDGQPLPSASLFDWDDDGEEE